MIRSVMEMAAPTVRDDSDTYNGGKRNVSTYVELGKGMNSHGHGGRRESEGTCL